MGKKEKMGYQILCLALLIAVVVLIWQNKKTSNVPLPEQVEIKSELPEEKTYLLSENGLSDEFQLPRPNQAGGMPLMEAFKERKTTRTFVDKPLSDQQISNLLWAANGINRPEAMRRTVPTASNNQEIDVYLFTKKAIYLYDAANHTLKLKKEGDYRVQAGKNEFFKDAPVALTFVADFDRMAKYDKASQEFYSATDVGFVSQNVYLFCASENLSTVVCGYIDRDAIKDLLNIDNGKVLLSQPIGFSE